MNDQEKWDLMTEMRQDIKDIKKEMSTLKVKVASVSAVVGAIISMVTKKLGL